MRRYSKPLTRVVLSLVLLTVSSTAMALPPGIPDPAMSSVALSPPTFACHWRFKSNGTWDVLTVTALVLDSLGLPVPGTPISFSLVPVPGTLAFCTCDPNPVVIPTTPVGVAVAKFAKVGGRGPMGVVVDAVGFGPPINLGMLVIPFTSTDLSGSCDPPPASATTVVDLGIWATGLPPAYNVWSDYDCSGPPIGIVDLALWASGLGVPCF